MESHWIMVNENYCKLFIDATISRSDLVDAIQKSTNGIISNHFVDCDWGAFDVRNNDEYSRWKIENSGDDGFLFYKYIVDVEPKEPSRDSRTYIGGLRGLIQSLRSTGTKIVAACDFEDQL